MTFPKKMTPEPARNLVRCADEMHRIYWGGIGRKSIAICLIWGCFAAIGYALHADWPQVVGLVVIVATVVGPHIVRIHRGYTRQICPSCGQQVGNYDSSGSRIHLVCRHCGERSSTDCAIHYAGGPPSKVG